MIIRAYHAEVFLVVDFENDVLELVELVREIFKLVGGLISFDLVDTWGALLDTFFCSDSDDHLFDEVGIFDFELKVDISDMDT